MFELLIARKYLIPRWRQLSVSIISMISVLVISLVVWLILVFFSVTNGLESIWTEKLIAMTAPIRVTPTQDYYDSYYYQIDSISEASDYVYQSIRDKRDALESDPYDPDYDRELPNRWLAPDYEEDGTLRDLVKGVFGAVEAMPGVSASDYEMAFANLDLQLLRKDTLGNSFSQSIYLGSFDQENLSFEKNLLALRAADLENLLLTLARTSKEGLKEVISSFFQTVTISHLETPLHGWRVPPTLLSEGASFKGVVLTHGGKLAQVILPLEKGDVQALYQSFQQEDVALAEVVIEKNGMSLQVEGKEKKLVAASFPLVISAGQKIPAHIEESSFESLRSLQDLRFLVNFDLQGTAFETVISFGEFRIAEAKVNPESDTESLFWVHRKQEENQLHLPNSSLLGDGVLLPKPFLEAGARVGDRGSIVYSAKTTSGLQEQRLPIYVAGFYDHGVIPIGGKFLLVDESITSLVRSSYPGGDQWKSAGINVRFDDLERTLKVKESLEIALAEKGLSRYWKIESYDQYEFTRDVIQQLRSERNLFSLIAAVIIIVACSNIISMLIILVNDKRVEIGILRAMGASSRSIAAIFGFCGFLMGFVGSWIGIALAYVTLKNIQPLLDFIGSVQGHAVLNQQYFGDTLPTEISGEALIFVLTATTVTSVLAGVVPAVKASLLRPAAILRSE